MQSHEERADEMLRIMGGSMTLSMQRNVLRRLILSEDAVVEHQALQRAAEQEARRLQRILLIDGAGATACLTGEPFTSNPYEQPSEDWHVWRQGWERIEYKAMATEMACYIDTTKPLVSMVTLESDDKPPSPEIAQANRLLARWDALKDGRSYSIEE